MKVKELIKVSESPFKVMVKDPRKGFEYECLSSNTLNYEDFADREVYEVSFSLNKVYCW